MNEDRLLTEKDFTADGNLTEQAICLKICGKLDNGLCGEDGPAECDSEEMRVAYPYFEDYFQTVVIPAERAAARKEALEEIEGWYEVKWFDYYGYHMQCKYTEYELYKRWQQLKGGQ